MLNKAWEKIYKEKDLRDWHILDSIAPPVVYPMQYEILNRLLEKYYRTGRGGPPYLDDKSSFAKMRMLRDTMDRLDHAIKTRDVHEADTSMNTFNEIQRRDESEDARLEREKGEFESRQTSWIPISYREADAVQDYIGYIDKFKDKDFSDYARQLKGKKKKKKKKKKGRKKKGSASAVPNPLRQNYDYSGEMGGPEWQNRVKNYMKKKRKHRRAMIEEIGNEKRNLKTRHAN